MNSRMPIVEADGTLIDRQLDDAVVNQLQTLVENAAAYFDLSKPHLMIPLEQLVSTRARPAGIISANRLMRQAAAGAISPRDPVSVGAYRDQLWQVLDGNSTVANARFSGWHAIPCTVREEPDQ